MKGKNRHRSHIDGSRLITIISVAMVLLVMGITVVIGIGVRQAGRIVRSNVGFVAVVNPAYGSQSLDSVKAILDKAPFAENVTMRSADEVLKRWEQMMGPEEMLDVNPFLPEYEVTVKTAWAKPDSLEKIASRLRQISCVDQVQLQTDIVSEINHSVSSVFLLLLLVGIALLVISIALIANTVKLQIHAQRFVIHTQQYVGATPGYIVSPYVKRAALNGLYAALIASCALVGIAMYAGAIDPIVGGLIDIPALVVVVVTLLLIGVGLCAITAMVSAKKYIRSSYDEIYN